MNRPQKHFCQAQPQAPTQLEAEVAIFPINPTTQPPTHPGKFEIDLKQQILENKSC